jgi:4-amino-4-deoxy-L-arabinose transferase-like glycosyltransferase
MTRERKHLLPWLIALAAFTGLLLPAVVQEGMFMDGLWYAAISKNMANGNGSLWAPHFSDTLFPAFYEHPPLVFGIQSLFFRLFGDAFWIERLYSFLTAIITLLLIVSAWKNCIKDSYGSLAWFAILSWLSIPMVHWAYANNILENTMGLFTLLAFIFLVKSIAGERKSYLWQAVAAGMIVCAFLCKGFTGLFPLSFYFAHWVAFRRFSFTSMLGRSMILFVMTVLLFIPFFLYEPSYTALTTYFKTQVVSSIQGAREPVGHFFIVKRLLMEMAIIIPLTGIPVFMLWRKGMMKDHPYKRHSLFFLLVGLSASLPIMISQKQSGFYALASIPFFAMSAAAIAAPLIKQLIDKANERSVFIRACKILAAAGIAAVVIYSAAIFGKPARDAEKIGIASYMKERFKGPSTISTCSSLWHDWALHGYCMRYSGISLEPDTLLRFHLVDQSCIKDTLRGYKKISTPVNHYLFFEKRLVDPPPIQ